MKKQCVLMLVLSFLMTGCSAFRTITPVDLGEGKQGFVVDCSNNARGWDLCLEKAAKICESYDFEIVRHDGDGVYINGNLRLMPWDVVTPRAMMISCRK